MEFGLLPLMLMTNVRTFTSLSAGHSLVLFLLLRSSPNQLVGCRSYLQSDLPGNSWLLFLCTLTEWRHTSSSSFHSTAVQDSLLYCRRCWGPNNLRWWTWMSISQPLKSLSTSWKSLKAALTNLEGISTELPLHQCHFYGLCDGANHVIQYRTVSRPFVDSVQTPVVVELPNEQKLASPTAATLSSFLLFGRKGSVLLDDSILLIVPGRRCFFTIVQPVRATRIHVWFLPSACCCLQLRKWSG